MVRFSRIGAAVGVLLWASGAFAKDGFEVALEKRLASRPAVDAVARKSLFYWAGKTASYAWGKRKVALMPADSSTASVAAPKADPAPNPFKTYVEAWRGDTLPSLPRLFPKDIDNRRYEQPVFDQGDARGTCWANAISSAMATHLKSIGIPFIPSREHIVSKGRANKFLSGACIGPSDLSEGANVNRHLVGMRSNADEAVCAEQLMAYQASCDPMPRFSMECEHANNRWRVTEFTTFGKATVGRFDARNVRLIETLLILRRPVMLSVNFAGDWTGSYAKDKVIDVQREDGLPEKSTSNHVVVLVGYHHDKDPAKSYFIMKNSWGADWARAGYGYLSYDYVMTYAYELSVIAGVRKR
jgi:hypothetical protein